MDRFVQRQRIQIDLLFGDPLLVGVGSCQLILDLIIRHNTPLLQIGQKHLARLQSSFEYDILRRELKCPCSDAITKILSLIKE